MRAPTPSQVRPFFLSALIAMGAPPPASAQSVAEDPNVAAQIELFSNWLEGQVEIRGLPCRAEAGEENQNQGNYENLDN